jgi:hypothetical protein
VVAVADSVTVVMEVTPVVLAAVVVVVVVAEQMLDQELQVKEITVAVVQAT